MNRARVELYDYYLKELADSQTGPFGSQLHESDYVDDGTPIVTVEHLGDTSFSTQNLPNVSDDDKERLKKYVLKEGDIVFSRVGSIDRCTYVSKKEEGWMYSGRCIRVRANEKVNSKYLSFYFRQDFFKKMMKNISVGATMPSLNTKLMDNIPLKLPSKIYQNRISKVLSDLDAKIELNNKINSELEAMAKLIYDYWFVQFDFPDENGKPYKSSGGKMVFNEELKREIPEGWEVKKLNEIADLKAGGDKPKDISEKKTEKYNIPIYSNGVTDDGLYGFTNNPKVLEPSITVSARGTIGFSVLRMKPFVPIIRLISVTPKNKTYLKFLHERIKLLKFDDSGSVQKQLTVPMITNLKLVVPKAKYLVRYNEMTLPYIKKIEINKEENLKLAELRDWLLPMLMNGQVKVK